MLCTGLLLSAAVAEASANKRPRVLRAYGPGGPHHAIKECADLFRERHGVSVEVFKASPAELIRKLGEDGDIYFGGAEYILDDLARENPGILDLCVGGEAAVAAHRPRGAREEILSGSSGSSACSGTMFDLLVVVNLENIDRVL